MRAGNSLPLDDIVDHIFTLCPNLETLDALRGVCKALHAVFSTHPNSITTAVALSQQLVTGPYLIGVREEALLASNAAVVHRLEAIFSRWYKDRNSTSVLAAQETYRFRRAMHRVMMYTKRFSICDESLAMLSEYPAPDLRDARTDLEDPDQCYDICIAAGPALVLANSERHDMNLMDELCPMYDSYEDIPLFAGFVSSPLAQIWESREAKPPPEDYTHLSSILNVVPDGLDSCQQCAMPAILPRVWTSATWEHLNVDPPSASSSSIASRPMQ
ncbi:hypothetical protein DFH09DRAFT_1372530 [Mycena vulgaris]|nr:hypothetical protein DFH09DRAFT_1372530 [Mycena vulgaris]